MPQAAVDAVRRRIVYRLTGPVYDGLPVDYQSADNDISHCLAQIERARERYDLVPVDGHHTYECSLRDPRGVIVVHDCNPLTPELARPDFVSSAWNGETYLRCLGNGNLDDFTLEIDEGCGRARRSSRTDAAIVPGTKSHCAPDGERKARARVRRSQCSTSSWRSCCISGLALLRDKISGQA